MLTAMGNTVVEATSYDEALALIEGLPEIKRILSDISLIGEKTGIDLRNALPENAPPIHLMTSRPLMMRCTKPPPPMARCCANPSRSRN